MNNPHRSPIKGDTTILWVPRSGPLPALLDLHLYLYLHLQSLLRWQHLHYIQPPAARQDSSSTQCDCFTNDLPPVTIFTTCIVGRTASYHTHPFPPPPWFQQSKLNPAQILIPRISWCCQVSSELWDGNDPQWWFVACCISKDCASKKGNIHDREEEGMI